MSFSDDFEVHDVGTLQELKRERKRGAVDVVFALMKYKMRCFVDSMHGDKAKKLQEEIVFATRERESRH